MDTPPKIVGILNLTEDSFSDGGQFLAPEAAVQQAEKLAREGADILELGPASSHPDARSVSADQQIRRLGAVLTAREARPADLRDGLPVSVDATTTEVLRFALAADVSMLNDVRGFSDSDLYPELADSSTNLVVVHSLLALERATRDSASVDQVLASIDRFFETRLSALVAAGIAEDRLIVDPGMGFFLGNNPDASVAVLQRIEKLRERFGRPVFISVSRKSFLRKITGIDIDVTKGSGAPIDSAALGAATLTAELFAARGGADYIRTHDVGALRNALMVQRTLEKGKSTPGE